MHLSYFNYRTMIRIRWLIRVLCKWFCLFYCTSLFLSGLSCGLVNFQHHRKKATGWNLSCSVNCRFCHLMKDCLWMAARRHCKYYHLDRDSSLWIFLTLYYFSIVMAKAGRCNSTYFNLYLYLLLNLWFPWARFGGRTFERARVIRIQRSFAQALEIYWPASL